MELCHPQAVPCQPLAYLQLSSWYALPPLILVQSHLNQSCQLTSKEVFPPLGQVDSIRPYHTLCLKDSSVVIKAKVPAEAPVLEPAIDVLGVLVSSSVSPHYWED